MHDAVNRECLATRNGVGIIDASTLGKIDIQGPDAREFLNRVYTNAWSKLPVGRCRYGLMCGEDGMVFDDGVTSCISDNHFVMTTTSGGAARVFQWLEVWHQTEWPDLDVYFNSVTDHWATLSISGPKARLLLAELTDIDLNPETFKFMDLREGEVAGVPARVFRISFTETMHVLRAEKGFIIVGQDTDGSMTPYDLDMGWAVSPAKEFSFLGKRSLDREDCLWHVVKGGLDKMGEKVYMPQADGTTIEAEICSPVFYDPKGERQNV
ncbi:Sarcosine oxidase subunit alpha [Nymphon striatum]|nr:Sarcosine oxidase subunit alpha [Nymphon striatum]